jgi:hypothetical protein
MMNTKQLKNQVKLLTDYIEYGTVVEEDYGLCDNVLRRNFPSYDVFPSWEHYSGDLNYPVGSGYYDYNDSYGRRHDRRTTYGKLRLALAKHCLAWCEKELKDTV